MPKTLLSFVQVKSKVNDVGLFQTDMRFIFNPEFLIDQKYNDSKHK